VTVNTLVKGFVTGAAAVAVVAAAAGGVTTIAASGPSTAPAFQPVGWDFPMPEAPDLQGPLQDTINALGSGGPFSSKLPFIEPLGKATRVGAELKYNDAVKKGYFPLSATVADIVENGDVATANVSATSANGATAGPMPLTFLHRPTGWVLTRQSLADLAGAMG
jgi:hypothetical protein